MKKKKIILGLLLVVLTMGCGKNLISIEKAVVELSQYSYVYDGTEKKPTVESVILNDTILKDGTDYTVAYKNNTEPGESSVVITGIGDYKENVTKTFEIEKRNGLYKANDGKWYYYKENVVDTTYTGMAKNDYGWFYITKGKLDTKYTGMAKNEYGWWYMTNGKLDTKYTGMAKNKYGWFYMTNGRIDASFEGIAPNSYGKWYMKDGKLQDKFTGTKTFNNVTYTIKNGEVTNQK